MYIRCKSDKNIITNTNKYGVHGSDMAVGLVGGFYLNIVLSRYLHFL